MTIIRKAIVEDARILANLNRAVHEPHVNAQPENYKPFITDNPALIEVYIERIQDESNFILIAEENNTAVGYVHCVMRERVENPFIHSNTTCLINELAVAENHQSQGIGKLLMEDAMRIGQERGAKVFTLGVAAFNHGAIKFYERLGFTISSHRMSKSVSDS